MCVIQYTVHLPVLERNARIPDHDESLLQAEVFEEIATMEFPFEGIPTIPPRKDMDHMVDYRSKHSCHVYSTASCLTIGKAEYMRSAWYTVYSVANLDLVRPDTG